MAHSVLVIPVPEMEPFIRARWEHHDPAWVSRDPAFTHAHITVLAPFLPAPGAADLDRIAAIARTVAAFDFSLGEIGTFPNGIIHLVPEPAGPFRTLTAAVADAFPQCPPYAGEFAGDVRDLVPHLTLDSTIVGVTEAGLAGELADVLPVAARADRVELQWYEEGGCRVLAQWPLSGPA